MSLNYDTFSIKSSILDEIKTAELNIKDNDLLSKVIRARLHGFYGTMYGRPKDEIVYIESRDFNPAINVDGNLTYIWGWPGPDYNVYEYEDYGITWALTLDDFNMEKVNG